MMPYLPLYDATITNSCRTTSTPGRVQESLESVAANLPGYVTPERPNSHVLNSETGKTTECGVAGPDLL